MTLDQFREHTKDIPGCAEVVVSSFTGGRLHSGFINHLYAYEIGVTLMLGVSNERIQSKTDLLMEVKS